MSSIQGIGNSELAILDLTHWKTAEQSIPIHVLRFYSKAISRYKSRQIMGPNVLKVIPCPETSCIWYLYLTLAYSL